MLALGDEVLYVAMWRHAFAVCNKITKKKDGKNYNNLLKRLWLKRPSFSGDPKSCKSDQPVQN